MESSPLRREAMDGPTVARVLHLLSVSHSVTTLDVTGGAPELHPLFRELVRGAHALGKTVITRCNLTVLFEPGQEDLAAFYAEHRVVVVASLPCYTEDTTDAQRGKGVFTRSIAALQALNAVGYGVPGSGLVLDLMYNPAGPFMPPPQASLEAAYRQELADAHGIVFSSLFTLTNMPIKRFADRLHQTGQLEAYMNLLLSSFNPSTLGNLMCTQLVSVDWRGRLFDCDFNQALDLPAANAPTIFTVEHLSELGGARVRTDLHCLGCTAGAGSSCTGQLA